MRRLKARDGRWLIPSLMVCACATSVVQEPEDVPGSFGGSLSTGGVNSSGGLSASGGSVSGSSSSGAAAGVVGQGGTVAGSGTFGGSAGIGGSIATGGSAGVSGGTAGAGGISGAGGVSGASGASGSSGASGGGGKGGSGGASGAAGKGGSGGSAGGDVGDCQAGNEDGVVGPGNPTNLATTTDACIRATYPTEWADVHPDIRGMAGTVGYPVPFSWASCVASGTGNLTGDHQSVRLFTSADPGCDTFIKFEGTGTTLMLQYYP